MDSPHPRSGPLLVTGAGGVIGRRLVTRAVGEGRDVIALDRAFPAGRPAGARVLETELRPSIGPEQPDVAAIVHLAAEMSNSTDVAADSERLLAANLQSLLFTTALAPNARRLVLASTMVVYGPPRVLPVGEDHPLEPANLYGAAKKRAEQVAAWWGEAGDRSAASLRIASVYGPDDPPGRAIPSFVAAVRAGRAPEVRGRVVRDYVWVDDVVAALLAAVDSDASGAFNVGTGTGTDTVDLARAVTAAAGAALEPDLTGDARGTDVVLDCGRAARELGWRAEVDLAEGLRRLFA